MRFLPKSLAGQMIALTLTAIFAAQIIGLWVFADERRFALQAAAHQQAIGHTASLIKLISRTPPALHQQVIDATSTEMFQATLDRSSQLRRRKINRVTAPLILQLQELTQVEVLDLRVKLHRQKRDWLGWHNWKMKKKEREWAERWEDRWEEDDDHRDDHWDDDDHRNDHHLLSALPPRGSVQELSISIQLPNGLWLNIDSFVLPSSKLWALPSIVGLILSAIALTAIVIFMTYRVTRPVKELTIAAEKFGRGEQPDKLVAMGPSDIRAASEAFNQMQERLDRFVKDRTRMLAAISHDLRTPLTSLRIQAEFIEDEALRDKILSVLLEMQSMIEATLSFAKQDALNEAHGKADLYALLESIAHDHQDMGHQVTVSGAEGLTLSCRPISMKRALRNLIDNAVKYGNSAEIELKDQDKKVAIYIRDQGPGVAVADLDRIFEPFIRLDKARNTESGSVGLGLSIARSIINAHGGEITLRNLKEGGLEVAVTLPKDC